MRRIASLFAVSLMAALLVALLLVGVAGASASHPSSDSSDGRVLTATLTPDLGPQVEPTIGGIAPGGLPWVLKGGHVTISSSGLLEASVEGLLFGPGAPSNLIGTRGPITTVSASLVCANGPIVTTDTVAFSTEGNAHFHQTIALPAHCVGPTVLIRAFATGPWLASSGF
jgi:hypothetical protein